MSDKLALASQWLEESRPSFEEMNLNKLDFAKEKEFMIQAFQNNPYLLGMEPNSVRNILVNCALTGITLNPVMKFGYPVPRKGKLCLDVSYMGMIKIATDTGSVKSIKAAIVYENEPFDIDLGSNGFVKHKPYFGTGGKGRRLGCYSIAVLNDGSTHIHWMYEQDIQAIKARSESVKAKKQSPWDSDYDEMAKKTVIKQHFKYLPKSERAEMAANAIAMDNENNGIDFEAERREAGQKANKEKSQSLNIDVLDPNNPEHVEKWNGLLALFQDKSLPAKWTTHKGAEFDKKATGIAMYEEFQAGTLTIAKANKTVEYLKQVIKHFKSHKTEETDG